MKKTLIPLFLFISFQIFATESIVVFNLHDSTYNHTIEIYEPIDGAFNDKITNKEAKFSETRSKTGFTYRYDGTYPGWIEVTVNKYTFFHLVLLPDNKINVDLYPDKNSRYRVIFSGSNAEGLKWYHDWDQLFWRKWEEVTNIFNAGKQNYQEIYNEVVKSINSTVSKFDSVALTKPISKDFRETVKRDIELSLISDVVNKYTTIAWANKYGKISKQDSIIISDIRKQIFATYPPFAKENMLSPAGSSYLGSYLVLSHLWSQLDKKQYINEFGQYKFYGVLPPEILKTALGQILTYEYLNNGHSTNKEIALNIYKTKFPNSQYYRIIQEFQKQADQSPEDVNKSVNKMQIDSTGISSNIKTLKELHDTYFKGKKIFIDLWATWCIPCKVQLRCANEVDSLAKKYDITLVYISVDNVKSKKSWIDDIKGFKLYGNHYLANEMLLQDLKTRFYKNNNINIPRYFFMDENGNMVNDDAPRPESLNELENMFKNSGSNKK